VPLTPLHTTEPIAGYTVTERIGAGGYGEVWRAEAPGGLVKAIKFVYGYLSDERAARELKALNRIKQTRHPFLLSLERIEVVDGQLVIVTELADMSLKDRFQQCLDAGHSALPRDEVLTYLRDTADALDYLTEAKLQHLDIKPENILLLGGRVKVADFGLVKDIQERTCSMLGGMTPVYASPEVFDGRPSRHSDQYSLAILYQEMLTGVLPFPGTTSAQLAAQHLHSRPRLEPLPESDRPVIARALSKDPTQRFASCREMVECLLAGGIAKPRAETPPADPTRDTTPVSTQVTEAGPIPASPLRRTPTPAIDSQHMTEALGALGSTNKTNERPSRSSWVRPAPAAPVTVDLPPIEVPEDALGLRPTLIVGVGGTAAWTLRRLRARLQERFGSLSDLPTVQMLLLDTDSKDLAAAAGGDDRSGLDPRDTLLLPLRKPQDYRNESRDMLRWLSRRWLFNIPRSLQTEGLRPLGRLAFVDQAEECFKRVRLALERMTTDEALATAHAATGAPIRNAQPRVFLLANIAGGAGGGMALDLMFALRGILASQGFDEFGLCSILAHSTSRKPSAKDLAIANTHACLTELRHYLHVSGYPGEASCGLPAWSAGGEHPPTYVVHMGDELSGGDFRAATDSLAEYLYLDIATPAGAALDRCREPVEKAEEPPPAVRTFGIHRVGCSESAIPLTLGEVLCRGLFDLWVGERSRRDRPSGSSSSSSNGEAPAPSTDPIDSLVAKTLEDAQLSASRLLDEIRDSFGQALNGQLEPLVEERLAAAGADVAALPKLLESLVSALGLGTLAAGDDVSINVPLELEALIRHRGAEGIEKIQHAVLACVETPEWRLAGAGLARQKFVEALSRAEAAALEAREQAQLELDCWLSVATHSPAAGRRGRVAPAPRSAIEQKSNLIEYVRLRLDALAAGGAAGLFKSLAQRLSALGDRLTDYRRDATRLAGSFDPPPGWAGTGSLQPSQIQGLDKISLAVVTSVRSRLPALAADLDARVQRDYLARQGGLLAMLGRGADAQRQFVSVLRGLARKVVRKALQEIDVTRIVLDTAAEEGQPGGGLKRCLEQAQPKLLACGGGRRLLMLAPESPTSQTLPGIVEQTCQQRPTLQADVDCDLVACSEVENVPLDGIAALLVDDAPQCAELARRLHTRVDVEWCDMVGD
jgi:serine/threonine protein kinase